MKITVLNECFLNTNHINRLKKIGELEIFKDTDSERKAIERLKDTDIALVDQFIAPFSKTVLESTNRLKLLCLNTIGYGLVDLETANKKNIKVANIPGFSKQSVAELAIGLMFAATRKISLGDRYFRATPTEPDLGTPAYDQFISFDIKGKTLGIVGLGTIGKTIAEIGKGLGMKVIAFNRTPKHVTDITMVSLEEIFKQSDVVMITLSFNKETEKLISTKYFKLMKPLSVFISITSPATVVDLEALYEVLKTNKIWGAGIDIGSGLKENHPLLKLDNIVFTPHIGAATQESFYKILPDMMLENIEHFISGKPLHIINT